MKFIENADFYLTAIQEAAMTAEKPGTLGGKSAKQNTRPQGDQKRLATEIRVMVASTIIGILGGIISAGTGYTAIKAVAWPAGGPP